MTVSTLILIGELDDLTPAQSCRDLVAGLGKPGTIPGSEQDKVIRLVVLPGAYHAFDNTSFPTGQRFLGHWLEYNADATKRSIGEIKGFLHANLRD
jgi:dienelactone hydrolase